VIFAQMVDDPSAYVDVLRADPKLHRKAETALKARLKLWDEARALAKKTEGTGLSIPEPGPAPTLDDMLADLERQRLFRIIEDLVLWENTTNETVLQAARDEIWQSWRRACAENADHPRAKELFDRKKLPAFHDPFAGGGALPLEAQRLGLETYASDLNPVAVLINKAMIEIPPKFAGKPPVNPESRKDKNLFAREWKGAQGLAEDVRYYGQWMRDEAEKRIGHLYPKVEVTAEMVKVRPDLKQYAGKKLTVIAWHWARTVKSPNPAFAQVDVPLASTFMLSTKPGKEAYIEPVIENGGYQFTVKVGRPTVEAGATRGMSAGKWNAFRCLMSNVPVTYDYIRGEGVGGRLGSRLMAVVVEGERGRVYLSPTPAMEAVALQARPRWIPELAINYHPRDIKTQIYGLTKYGDLFTPRQLVALNTFSDLLEKVRKRAKSDAIDALQSADDRGLVSNGVGAAAYADALAVYLAFAIDKGTNYWSSLCAWSTSTEKMISTFGRQALPMVWDFTEANPFSESSGNWDLGVDQAAKMLCRLGCWGNGVAEQASAQSQEIGTGKIVSSDPPYYDNIGYADLSDFFYVWLRRSLGVVFPNLFATLAVPKSEELVATPYRHGSKEKAEAFFLEGMTQVLQRLGDQAHPAFPVTIYYAFKQAESDRKDGPASTGWETFVDAVIHAGFSISGTWPMRTEYTGNLKKNMSALASSIVLVCRPRRIDAPNATRREFVTALKTELPVALAYLQRGNIAPVDLAQAAIGPGMAVYTRYAKVLDAEGKPLRVREALALINQTLDEALAEQEGDFDADSRWALTWFEQSGFDEGEYGVAEVLATAKATSIAGLNQAGILASGRGKVRLLRPDELSTTWDPAGDARLTAWEIVHHLIRVLAGGGEDAAAELVERLGTKAEVARELAYRLYALCERKKRAAEALAYNGLVQSWPEIARLAREGGKPRTEQGALFGETTE
jgi:putative DNA methylase